MDGPNGESGFVPQYLIVRAGGGVLRRFWSELKDRNVVKVATVYLVAAWVVMQVADVMFPALALPEWTVTLVAGLLIVGFPVALVLAWALELTPEGLRLDRGTPQAEQPVAGDTPVVATASDLSVGVLPFLDLSAERDQAYFADGMSEELLNVLSRLEGLRVASRTSCFALKGKDVDIAAAAQRLHVTYIVEGSVRKAGKKLRITAQLIDAASDSRLWSETYQRELDDIFAIQDDIAQQIAAALKLSLQPDDRPKITTDDARAYDYYLRGRSYIQRFGPKNLQQAIQMFNRATEIDDGYALAWSGLAQAHAALAMYYGGGEPERQRADATSQRALELAPELGVTHTSRGLAHIANGERKLAEQEFTKAIELDDSQFEAYYQYGRIAYAQGRLEKALDLLRRAAKVDPEDFQAELIAGPILRGLGRPEEAHAAFARGCALAEKHLVEHPNHARAYVMATTALHLQGQTEKAHEYARRALEIDPDDPSTLYNLACFYAQSGKPDEAMDCLERAMHSLEWIEHDSDLDPLRDLPRFQAYLLRLRA